MDSTQLNSKRSEWLVVAGLLGLSLVPALAGTARLAELAVGAEVTPANARFHAAPVPIVIHVVTATLFSIVGSLLFAPSFRRRRRGWHRIAGRILAPCGVVVALSGLWMAQFYPAQPGDGVMVYIERLIFGAAMLVSILLALDAVRRRDFASHGAWMIRGYAIGLGAGTQVLTHLPWFLLVEGWPGELPRAIMMGAGWIINVAVAEWIIRRAPARDVRQTAPIRAHRLSATSP